MSSLSFPIFLSINEDERAGKVVFILLLLLLFSVIITMKRRETTRIILFSDEANEVIQKKSKFLSSNHASKYGYKNSCKGFIDKWRENEFPSLIKPIPLVSNAKNRLFTRLLYHREFKTTQNNIHEEVYLDYAGASIPTKSQLDKIHEMNLKFQVLANPHSSGIAASRSSELIEKTKKMVLDYFGANPGCHAFSTTFHQTKGTVNCSSKCQSSDNVDYHPGYDIIFTSGATEAFKIVSEQFPWSSSTTESESYQSTLLYPHNSHTSVIGMRGPALQQGATFICENLSTFSNVDVDNFYSWGKGGSTKHDAIDGQKTSKYHPHTHNTIDPSICYNLLVLPMESNFSGEKPNIQKIISTAHAFNNKNDVRGKHSKKHRWMIMLDLAKAASTSKLNLCELNPDFACVSFYKIFGFPTGIGALFVKRTCINLLVSDTPLRVNKHRYFGGGSADMVLAREDIFYPRSSPSKLTTLTSGTVNYRGISSLMIGFDEIDLLGGIQEVSAHAVSLTIETVLQLRKLHHANGLSLIDLYGPWKFFDIQRLSTTNFDPVHYPGTVIAFNVLRHDGSYVGYHEVAKLGSLFRVPIQMRVGCFCNPGGCQQVLGYSDEDVKNNYHQAGHVCGDDIDIINEKPTGAVRVSFGKDSLWEDMYIFINFLKETFLNERKFSRTMNNNHSCLDDKQTSNSENLMLITNMYIFPIKSCAAMNVSKWKVNKKTGKFLFDREFALVDSSGTALRLSNYPRMALIHPIVDTEKGVMIIKAPGCSDLILDLHRHNALDNGGHGIQVCGDHCGGLLWNDDAISAKWFSSFLGIPCWLVQYRNNIIGNEIRDDNIGIEFGKVHKKIVRKRGGFENEAPMLLVNQHSVDILNDVLMQQNSQMVDSKHFRANLVVRKKTSSNDDNIVKSDSYQTHPEDMWRNIKIPRCDFEMNVVGKCARCSMVDINPMTAMKGKTLRGLAQYRRDNGKLNFGIYLSPQEANEEGIVEIEVNDIIVAS